MPPQVFDSARAMELLRLGTQNPRATFHAGQEEAIRHVVDGRGRLLVVQATGWGKSSVYFIGTKMLREQGAGPVLLISPLLALMRNQIAAAQRMGVQAFTINSENTADWKAVETAQQQDAVDILLVSPERLANRDFLSAVLAPVAARISMLVVDEAHCISDWGHDFRPQYRLIERIARTLPRNLRLLATTATANNRVLADLQTVLGPGLTVSRGNLHRPSLLLQTMRLPSQPERMAWLATHLPHIPSSGIIYTLTVRDAVQVAEWLKSRGIDAEAYTSETGERRVLLENALLGNQIKALVATPALGMGFDKPDLGFVIHYQTPGSVVSYYQQVGRAGRALAAAYGVLLSGTEETDITNFFIENAFPSRPDVERVLAALHAESAGLSVRELEKVVNVSHGKIEKVLQLLSLESPAPLVKDGSKWQLTVAVLGENFWHRAARLSGLRRAEQQAMQEYVDLRTGHMEFLINALDGNPGSTEPPNLPPLPATVTPALVQDALAFLRRTSLPFEPRKIWPTGGLPCMQVSGKIAEAHRAQVGKVLCVWGDAGWGESVRKGKYHDRHFADDLVTACVGLMRAWSPQPAPAWITCIPSRRHPDLVPDFARRLAATLNLPFHLVLEKTDDRPAQKTMANSSQQARNIDGSLAIIAHVPTGPVFLVDDMVDSRWTLTVAAYLLTTSGSGPVYPLALASMLHSE